MPDELSILKLVTARLEAAGIAYMLTGSLAAGHYAQPRMTRDIDLGVELDHSDAATFAALFTPDFDVDIERIRAAISERAMFNLIHLEAVVKVDFVVRRDEPFRREEFARRKPVTIDGQRMFIASPEDLILSKLVWAKDSRSELQLRDVRQLLSGVPALDWAYLERWSAILSVATILRELRHD